MLISTKVLPTLVAGMLFLGSTYAQETPAAKAESAPAATTKAAPAAKADSATTKSSATKAPAASANKSAAAKPAGTAAKSPTAKTAGTKTAGVTTLKTEKEKFSYALGMSLGTNLHRQSVEVDPNIFAQGLRAALSGGKTLLTLEEAQAAIGEAQNEARKKQQEKMQVEGAANKKEGDVFLAANKTKEGVITLPSGLQYKILKEGAGAKPAATDSVVCNYRGTLINGMEFDSSYKRGQPATFPVSGVIKGWTEALQLMPVGSKWQLFIPPTLAYGEKGAGGTIGADATLVFEVELISIQDKTKTEDKPKTEEKPKTDEKK